MFQLFSTALSAFLMWAMPKVAVFFGIALVSTAVLKPIFEGFKTAALAQVSENAGTFLNAFEMMGGFDCISIIFAAYITAFSIKAAARASSH